MYTLIPIRADHRLRILYFGMPAMVYLTLGIAQLVVRVFFGLGMAEYVT